MWLLYNVSQTANAKANVNFLLRLQWENPFMAEKTIKYDKNFQVSFHGLLLLYQQTNANQSDDDIFNWLSA